MQKFTYSILFLICCFSAIVYGEESKQEHCQITTPEMCDQHPDCPRDTHAVGTNCPRRDPSPQ